MGRRRREREQSIEVSRPSHLRTCKVCPSLTFLSPSPQGLWIFLLDQIWWTHNEKTSMQKGRREKWGRKIVKKEDKERREVIGAWCLLSFLLSASFRGESGVNFFTHTMTHSLSHSRYSDQSDTCRPPFSHYFRSVRDWSSMLDNTLQHCVDDWPQTPTQGNEAFWSYRINLLFLDRTRHLPSVSRVGWERGRNGLHLVSLLYLISFSFILVIVTLSFEVLTTLSFCLPCNTSVNY